MINTGMRLQELTTLNEVTAFQEKTLMNNDWNSPRQVMGWLRSKGFRQKGAGQFGAAFVHPKYNRIVKISKREDKCWLRFAYWTLKMTSHPNVPFIDWVRVYGEGDKFFIAVVEKLSPFNRTAIMNTVDVPGLAYLYAYESWFDDDEHIFNRLVKEGIVDIDKIKYGVYREAQQSIVRQVKKYLKTAKGGKRFLQAIKSSQKYATGKCSYDMHDGNLMYRPSDKRIILIDPLADLSQISW